MKKILMTGANGLVGKALKQHFLKLGYLVFSTNRHHPEEPLYFNLKELPKNLEPFEGFDVLIHLAGESIAGIRWTETKKKRLLKERVVASENLKSLISHLKQPPKQVLIATGVGYYGSQSKAVMTEDSPKGEGFLANLAASIEKVWQTSQIKPVFMRFATVLSLNGGALEKISLPWKFHLLPLFGAKNHFFPFITLHELVKMIAFVIEKPQLNGPVNFCSEKPMIQEELFSKLNDTRSKKLSFVIPRWLIKILLGQMGEETLLVDLKVIPNRLKELDYPFEKKIDLN